MSDKSCGWAGSVDLFLKTDKQQWLESLKEHHQVCMNMPAEPSQITAWIDTYKVLKEVFDNLQQIKPESTSWSIVFEYELPRERGRRPDVLILAGNTILVLEFKGYSIPLQAHLDQVEAYARDLKNYHEASHDCEIPPILVLTGSRSIEAEDHGGTYVASPRSLVEVVNKLIPGDSRGNSDLEEWLVADYAPLPSLVAAARNIFQHEPLPQIRRAQSAGIPQTITELINIANQAQEQQEFHLALVTGVPGSGKTLVGLQFVYTNFFGDAGSARSAVFLSGNGPLVKVLQHALKSSIFVQDVHGFLRQYGGRQDRIPEEHIWIYDEAQRAWDAGRVGEKRGHAISEPEDFLRIGERRGDWALMIGLIGEGQEIHLGEEAGIQQWNEAIGAMNYPWIVHCPNHIADLFSEAHKVYANDLLNLNTTLRSHLAGDLQLWVTQLLHGQIEPASQTAKQVFNQGFDMYITADIEAAKLYVRERYHEQLDKRYGLLASSKAKNLSSWGIENGYNFTKNLREGPWYNDPPDSRRSCCQLHDVATEFACQGLELDFPLIGWGDDLRWFNNCWQSPPQRRSKARDPHQLRINSYRVLLTRGRDGFVIFVPPTAEMKETYRALKDAGVAELD